MNRQMTEEEIKKLKQKAQTYKDKIHSFISTTSPQIDGFKSSHRKYYEYVVTACGIFAGLTQALLASNFQKIDALATLGFIFFVLAVVLAFLGFKRDLVFGAKYTLGLKGIQKTLCDFSYLSIQFSTNEISAEEYKSKLEEFEKKYHDMRNNPDMEKTDAYENSLLKELSEDFFSNVNLITIALVSVAFSVALPHLICFK
jgi:hypothetical protein